MVGHCFGVSIGLTLGFGKTGAAATLKAGVNNCEKIGERDESEWTILSYSPCSHEMQ